MQLQQQQQQLQQLKTAGQDQEEQLDDKNTLTRSAQQRKPLPSKRTLHWHDVPSDADNHIRRRCGNHVGNINRKKKTILIAGYAYPVRNRLNCTWEIRRVFYGQSQNTREAGDSRPCATMLRAVNTLAVRRLVRTRTTTETLMMLDCRTCSSGNSASSTNTSISTSSDPCARGRSSGTNVRIGSTARVAVAAAIVRRRSTHQHQEQNHEQ